jgi:purine-nucleoside phosphorylase
MQEVGYPIRVLAYCGIKTLLLTSACGGVNPEFQVGDYVIVENHVNLTGLNPLIGANLNAIGPRFPSLLDGYAPTLMEHIAEYGKEAGLNIKRGVLGFLPGPGFETRAELEFLQRNNIDLIGWSSVPEAIVAMHAGLEVVSIVVVSDISEPSMAYTVSEEEVLRGATKNRDIFAKALKLFVTQL